MKEKISCRGTEKVSKMNSPALICQPVSASDNKNPPFDNERERNRTRKSKLPKEGTNIFDTLDGAKTRLLKRTKKRRFLRQARDTERSRSAVSTLSPSVVLGALSLSRGFPRAPVLSLVEGSDRGVEWVDLYFRILNKAKGSFENH